MSMGKRFIIDIERFLEEVESWKGTPFRHLGEQKGIGVDCVHLIRGMLINLDYPGLADLPMPRYPRDYTAEDAGTRLVDEIERMLSGRWVDPRDAQLGDLLVFRIHQSQWHVGIHIGNNRFVHVYEDNEAHETSLLDKFWKRKLAKCFVIEAHNES